MPRSDSAEALQDELVAAAWAQFEASAPQAIQDQLRAVPDLRTVVQAGMHLGIAASFDKAMKDEHHYAPVHKAMVSDLFELVGLARRTNKRVLSLRAIERLLIKYR